MSTRQELVEALNRHAAEMRGLNESNLKLVKSLGFFGSQLRSLASETGDWRKEDNENHSHEASQRDQMIAGIEGVRKGIEELRSSLKATKY